MKQAETLPGLQPDLDLFKLRRVAGFVIGNLLKDVSTQTPVEPHSYSQHRAIDGTDSPYEHYLNEGTLTTININPFWNLQVEIYTPRATETELEPIVDPAKVNLVGLEWWPNENTEGEMDEYFPHNSVTFSRRWSHDAWEPASGGNIPITEQLDMLLLIANIRQIKPPYTSQG